MKSAEQQALNHKSQTYTRLYKPKKLYLTKVRVVLIKSLNKGFILKANYCIS